jgi:hypothetical protein
VAPGSYRRPDRGLLMPERESVRELSRIVGGGGRHGPAGSPRCLRPW